MGLDSLVRIGIGLLLGYYSFVLWRDSSRPLKYPQRWNLRLLGGGLGVAAIAVVWGVVRETLR